MNSEDFSFEDYGAKAFYRLIDGRLVRGVPARRPEVYEKARPRGEEIARGNVLQVELGKDRTDLIGPKNDRDV